jgi:bisphosphoglycerate-dependent phosphoglycerate mutase
MNATRKMVDDLNIGTSFNASVAEKIEANLQFKDSLIRIISDVFYNTYNNLMQNKQDKLSALVLAGSWIEAMYITSQIYLTAQNKDAIASILIAHGNSLNKLLEILQPLSNDETIAPVYSDLLNIQKEYSRLGQEKKTSRNISTLIGMAEKLRAGITG